MFPHVSIWWNNLVHFLVMESENKNFTSHNFMLGTETIGKRHEGHRLGCPLFFPFSRPIIYNLGFYIVIWFPLELGCLYNMVNGTRGVAQL